MRDEVLEQLQVTREKVYTTWDRGEASRSRALELRENAAALREELRLLSVDKLG